MNGNRSHHNEKPQFDKTLEQAQLEESPPDSSKGRTGYDWKSLATRAHALTHLGLRSAGEVSRLVAEMHATISSTPGLSLNLKRNPFQGQIRSTDAPLPYQIVSGTFDWLSQLMEATSPGEVDFADSRWRRMRSALNGITGDKLEHWHNKLAIQMAFVDLHGHKMADSKTASTKGRVLFLHGLCHSELDWLSRSHIRYVRQLEEAGQQVIWLRYNSGLNIYQNGNRLADLLELNGMGDLPLTLIGHSMGGLVIRSACLHAQNTNQRWLDSLSQAAYIGTPHLGAPLERAGNLANSLIQITPYVKPFARLGNIRSQGIRDLRFGYITEAEAMAGESSRKDVRTMIEPLHPGSRHLFIASDLTTPAGYDLIGDGLVPVSSALGEHRSEHMNLTAPDMEKVFIEHLDHIAMLRDTRVYKTLEKHLSF
ncbi:hypothetical protein BTA51_09670 [Hahella sp. CCB-MM4]|uniref:esterase/lipase family protein n=1 Tax=Hahella sp. (strain CCB-MM4) TaxID=1926491 RepID=UPI000B9ABE13|nr:hypothetical protein [Hahella sp. CCB-MM4]OZG74031.1 hypothetical protein BTA51_09670 [Hahella sp. CCB-MM4]